MAGDDYPRDTDQISTQPKRKRVAAACDRCRRQKLKVVRFLVSDAGGSRKRLRSLATGCLGNMLMFHHISAIAKGHVHCVYAPPSLALATQQVENGPSSSSIQRPTLWIVSDTRKVAADDNDDSTE